MKGADAGISLNKGGKPLGMPPQASGGFGPTQEVYKVANVE